MTGGARSSPWAKSPNIVPLVQTEPTAGSISHHARIVEERPAPPAPAPGQEPCPDPCGGVERFPQTLK